MAGGFLVKVKVIVGQFQFDRDFEQDSAVFAHRERCLVQASAKSLPSRTIENGEFTCNYRLVCVRDFLHIRRLLQCRVDDLFLFSVVLVNFSEDVHNAIETDFSLIREARSLWVVALSSGSSSLRCSSRPSATS